MYVRPNFKTRKELEEAVLAGKKVFVFQPVMGNVPSGRASVSVEGPHYPAVHKWYAQVVIVDGQVTVVK